LLCALGRAGHETALFSEVDLPADRGAIGLTRESPLWCVSNIGLEPALSGLRKWHPDVIYGHGLSDPSIETRTLEAAPSVLFAHGYRGMCISGGKAFKQPVVRPCGRRFGWRCLMHFYPHRCGGLNPTTMWNDFRRESRRFAMLRSYQAIVTASGHMREEYLKQGFSPEEVKLIPLPADHLNFEPVSSLNGDVNSGAHRHGKVGFDEAHRLLFVGRMEVVKGGGVLLDALPRVFGVLGRPLQVTFVGDGLERRRWEQKAARLEASAPPLKIQFTGWLEGAQLWPVFRDSDLLVVPSLWPEPFGLIGPEAGSHGLPAAAFDVGGIADWLKDGFNGYLAPGDPPSSEGLAQAIIRCLRVPANYRRLRQGAVESARRFSLNSHVAALLELFKEVSRH
jgi:glycosyltransferase involved in cell wall biosynthesis